MNLRSYQQSAIEALRAHFSRGCRSVLFVLPTGGGKTVVFSEITRRAVAKGNRVCVIVHRVELLEQASRALTSLGVEHGRIKGQEKANRDLPVQVASVQTLSRRLMSFDRDRFDLLIVDEAHHAVAGSWSRVIDHFKHAKVLGVTATPCRLDGRGLKAYFQQMVTGPGPQQLEAEGYLASSKVFAPPIGFNAKAVRKRMGDFDLKEAEGQITTVRAMGDAVSHYRKHLDGGTAIAFCCSIAHAEAVAEAFNRQGIKASSIDGTMSDEERRERLEALETGELKVLTSCMLIGEGVDVPSVNGCLLLRPTQSLSLHLQMVGRCLRPAGDKVAVILDHVGNYERHGHHLEPREWSLEEGVKRSSKAKGPSVWVCPRCYCNANSRQTVCPECGAIKPVSAQEFVTVKGELVELNAEVERRVQEWAPLPIKRGDEVFHPVSGESGWCVDLLGRGWCCISNVTTGEREDVDLVGLRKDLDARRDWETTEQRERERRHKEWVRTRWFEEARAKARTYEELIQVGEAKGMRHPRGWARQVLAARQQAARRHPRTANYA